MILSIYMEKIEGSEMSYLKDFKAQITNHDYPAFSRLWEEYCASDEVDPLELSLILKRVKNSEFAEPFGRYVEKIFPLWEILPESDLKHEVFKLIIDLETTNTEALRQKVFEYLNSLYGEDSGFQEKIRLVGLKIKENFQGTVSHFELLNHMKKGNFVYHTAGWGVGEIMDVSILREELSLEFEYVAGKKEISFQNAFKTLIPIPKHHFLAMRFGCPDELEAKARENPTEVVRSLLRDLGPKTAAEIKDEMCDLVIPEAEWSKWWQSARAKLKKDTLIECPSELRLPFILRQSEVSHEERLYQEIENQPDAPTFIQAVYAFLRDFSDLLKNESFRATLQEKIQQFLLKPELSQVDTLQLYFLLEDVSGDKQSEEINKIIQDADSIETLIRDIGILAFRKRGLVAVRKLRDEWRKIFLNLLFSIEQNPARDYLLDELSHGDGKEELKQRLEDLIVHPGRHPEIFIWYFQKVIENQEIPFADQEGKNRFFEAFFILLSYLEQKGTHKEIIKKMYQIFSEKRYAAVRQILQGTDIETAKELLLLITKCHSLSDHDIKIFHSLTEVVHPSLAKMRKNSDGDQDLHVIWTTEEGFNKVKARMQQIATVETIQNAKEIEAARSHGDLRENAEFKAALEKRSRLQGELKLLSDQVNRARILIREDVPKDEVGIGTVVQCRSKSGETFSYTILGPWDADPEKSILSFQSKLAQSMKGLTVGDTFQFQGEEFTITALGSYFG